MSRRARFTASRHINLCILLTRSKLLYSYFQSCPRLCRSTAINHRQTIVAAIAFLANSAPFVEA